MTRLTKKEAGHGAPLAVAPGDRHNLSGITLDWEAPTIACPANLTDVPTGAGVCYATGVNLGAPTFGDNCPGATVGNDAPAQFPKGDTVVTWTVTDGCGHAATCQQTVTVRDHENPTITCPADLTSVPTDAGVCYATGVNLGTPTFGDNCPGATVGNDAPAQYPKGNTVVTWTVTDAAGNTATCQQTVTVKDHENPTITCPANLTDVPTAAGVCYATGIDLGTPTFGDNCPGATVDNDAPAQFPKGDTVVTWTVTDAAGNTATCQQTVTVKDHENPTITCPANLTDVPTDPGLCYATNVSLGSPTFGDNCPGATVGNNAPTQFPKGDTVVTWTVTDTAGNTATCQQTVTVKDHENPTITCPADLTNVPTNPGVCYATGVNLGTPTFGDNCPGATVSNDAPAQFPKGNTVVTWTVTDAAGNTATCTQRVTVVDAENPTITCPADLTSVPTDTGACYATNVSLGTPTFGDNCPGATVSNDAPAQFPKGTTVVTWTVTDAAGRTATCTQQVTVVDVESPTITCPTNLTDVPTDAGVCYATGVNLGTPAFGDNCPGATISNDAPAQFPKGNTVVTWTVTDAVGHTGTCTQQVTVVDHENPVIQNCPHDMVVPADAGACSAVVTWTEPTASDNCGVDSFTSDHDPGETFLGGTETIVTYTARDLHGNTATCSFKITVLGFSDFNPTVEIQGQMTADVTRCVRFVFRAGTGTPVTYDQVLTFHVQTSGNGLATAEFHDLPCSASAYDCVTAEDPLHTLQVRLVPTINDGKYEASFTNTDMLVQGDLYNDNMIDIVDFGVFVAEWGATYGGNPNTTCSTTWPHADINGNAAVDSPDFAFISFNFLLIGDPDCGGSLDWAARAPRTSITVRELVAMGLGRLAMADLNHDGVLDVADMLAFEAGARPGPYVQPPPAANGRPAVQGN